MNWLSILGIWLMASGVAGMLFMLMRKCRTKTRREEVDELFARAEIISGHICKVCDGMDANILLTHLIMTTARHKKCELEKIMRCLAQHYYNEEDHD